MVLPYLDFPFTCRCPGVCPGNPLEDTHVGHPPATARQRFTDGPLILCSDRMAHVDWTTPRRKYTQHLPGCGAAWLARLTGGQEVGSSNLPSPTRFLGWAGIHPASIFDSTVTSK